jgi:hypothetical protein
MRGERTTLTERNPMTSAPAGLETGTTAPGPLRFPRAPEYTRHRRALERLRGHTTSPAWIPEGLSSELDALREQMLQLRARAQESIDEITALDRRWRTEAREHDLASKHAARTGTEVEDRRTDLGERYAAEEPHVERLWATVEVLAETADEVIATLREQEPDLLASLHSQLPDTDAAVRKAERKLREVREAQWLLYKRAQWVMSSAEDSSFGRQPAPQPEVMPHGFSRDLLASAFERPWHRPLPKGTGAAA